MAAFGGHLFYDLFVQGLGGPWPPRHPLDPLLLLNFVDLNREYFCKPSNTAPAGCGPVLCLGFVITWPTRRIRGAFVNFFLHAVADLRAKAYARDALGTQILSISCSFWEILTKSYVGITPLPRKLAPPPQGNPGSATDMYFYCPQIMCHSFCPGDGGKAGGGGVLDFPTCIKGHMTGLGVCIQRGLVCIHGCLHPEANVSAHRLLWDTINEWAVHILLECILLIYWFDPSKDFINVETWTQCQLKRKMWIVSKPLFETLWRQFMVTERCHHRMKLLETCDGKSCEMGRWQSWQYTITDRCRIHDLCVGPGIDPNVAVSILTAATAWTRPFLYALRVELGSSQWGRIGSPQTVTDVVAKQSLGSWSLLWSLNSHSGCGSTSLWFSCRDSPDKGSVSCFGR